MISTRHMAARLTSLCVVIAVGCTTSEDRDETDAGNLIADGGRVSNDGAPGLDVSGDTGTDLPVTVGEPDAGEPGGCPGPNPRACYFGGGSGGICDHLAQPATCQDGAWVCTNVRGTPLVSGSNCRCFVSHTSAGPCRCENGAAICATHDAGGG